MQKNCSRAKRALISFWFFLGITAPTASHAGLSDELKAYNAYIRSVRWTKHSELPDDEIELNEGSYNYVSWREWTCNSCGLRWTENEDQRASDRWHKVWILREESEEDYQSLCPQYGLEKKAKLFENYFKRLSKGAKDFIGDDFVRDADSLQKWYSIYDSLMENAYKIDRAEREKKEARRNDGFNAESGLPKAPHTGRAAASRARREQSLSLSQPRQGGSMHPSAGSSSSSSSQDEVGASLARKAALEEAEARSRARKAKLEEEAAELDVAIKRAQLVGLTRGKAPR